LEKGNLSAPHIYYVIAEHHMWNGFGIVVPFLCF